MIVFDDEKVMLLQQLIIESSGGRAGVRDFGLLDSAIKSVYQTFDGQELYPTIEEKAARLGFNLITNHAFVDGNKRIGLLVMLTFLEINNIKLKITDDDLVNLGFDVAQGKSKYKDILSWIHNHKTNTKNSPEK